MGTDLKTPEPVAAAVVPITAAVPAAPQDLSTEPVVVMRDEPMPGEAAPPDVETTAPGVTATEAPACWLSGFTDDASVPSVATLPPVAAVCPVIDASACWPSDHHADGLVGSTAK